MTHVPLQCGRWSVVFSCYKSCSLQRSLLSNHKKNTQVINCSLCHCFASVLLSCPGTIISGKEKCHLSPGVSHLFPQYGHLRFFFTQYRRIPISRVSLFGSEYTVMDKFKLELELVASKYQATVILQAAPRC